jgi:hypothetical protein
LIPAAPGKAAGIARKSPSSTTTYAFDGILPLPSAQSLKACSTTLIICGMSSKPFIALWFRRSVGIFLSLLEAKIHELWEESIYHITNHN